MEVKESVMIISVLLIFFGWFVNSQLNRKHEIFKKRLDYRLKMLDSYVLAATALEKLRQSNTEDISVLTQDFLDKLENSHLQILMYGSSTEIKTINKIVSFAEQNNRLELQNKSAEFMNSIRNNLRNELGIKNI